MLKVREIQIPWHEATGPCKARHLAQQLWNGEEFYLQIDSHMRFVPGWDTKLKQMLQQAEAVASCGRAVISSYPPAYEVVHVLTVRVTWDCISEQINGVLQLVSAIERYLEPSWSKRGLAGQLQICRICVLMHRLCTPLRWLQTTQAAVSACLLVYHLTQHTPLWQYACN